jgi:predicted kinase
VARTDGQARSADERDVPNGRVGPDQLRVTRTTADHPRPWSREDLQQRLEWLPRGHPSSPYNADGSRRPPPPDLRALELPASSDDTPEPPARLTDAEHAEHVTQVRDHLAEAREKGLATDQQYVVDDERGLWTDERDDIHTEILGHLYAKAADIPNDHRAVMAGGLPGAGKTTVLESKAGIDRSQYLTVNPDDIKEEMARRGLIPQIEGLSPMEASELVHTECSYLAKRLAMRAMGDGKNLIWDITMASTESTERRLTDLDRAGYVTTGVFVDIPVEVGVRRADARYRGGNEDFRIGRGLGGRYVPPEVIMSQASADWTSSNRHTFETVKHGFDSWVVYDNSVDGRDAVTVASGAKRQDLREEG